MTTKIFVNLTVKDMGKSKQFFERLGFSFNEQFSNETALCRIVNTHCYIMLLPHSKFQEFSKKEIGDAQKTIQVLIALSADSRDDVGRLFNIALEAGGNETKETQDYDVMYSRGFEDIDGYEWSIIWVDSIAVKQNN